MSDMLCHCPEGGGRSGGLTFRSGDVVCRSGNYSDCDFGSHRLLRLSLNQEVSNGDRTLPGLSRPAVNKESSQEKYVSSGVFQAQRSREVDTN